MKKFRVMLPIEVIDEQTEKGGGLLIVGSTVELDEATAKRYAHALQAVEEPKVGGE